jgi:hypothetical protein
MSAWRWRKYRRRNRSRASSRWSCARCICASRARFSCSSELNCAPSRQTRSASSSSGGTSCASWRKRKGLVPAPPGAAPETAATCVHRRLVPHGRAHTTRIRLSWPTPLEGDGRRRSMHRHKTMTRRWNRRRKATSRRPIALRRAGGGARPPRSSAPYCLGTVPRECRPILLAYLIGVASQAWQMQQHREPRLAFDQRSDGGTRQPQNEVAFPVAGNGAIFNRGRTLADQNLRRHEDLGTTTRSLPGHTQCSPRTRASGEFTSKRTAPLDVQRLVNRFVTDTHRPIIGKVDRETMSNLLRTPRPRPSPVLPRTMASSVPPFPPGVTTLPDSRSWAYRCSAALVASLARLGRRAARSACH